MHPQHCPIVLRSVAGKNRNVFHMSICPSILSVIGLRVIPNRMDGTRGELLAAQLPEDEGHGEIRRRSSLVIDRRGKILVYDDDGWAWRSFRSELVLQINPSLRFAKP